jgi:tRNA-2-methylthio-N6-dimethylallyladenosine synthase
MNLADGELMEGVLASEGFEIVHEPAEADLILVNTCAIREHAERRVLGRVAELYRFKRARPDLLIGVTGCMAQRMGASLLEKAPYVDLVMGPDGYRSIPRHVDAIRRGRERDAGSRSHRSCGDRAGRVQLAVLDLDETEHYEGLEVRRRSSASAWVPIQRGCDHRCTFCIVPYVRGPEKNRAARAVLQEVTKLAGDGVTEVTLLGQTVNSYEWEDWRFSHLLRAVARVEGIRRVRFTSPHPKDVTLELVEVMAEEPAVCEQLHLPVQSGSDRTLKRMARKYSVRSFLDTVEMVRWVIPDIALSTDTIVGFPGETEQEFEQTLDLMRAVRFDEAFTYKYSLREGTPATRLPAEDFVAPQIAQARLEALIEVARTTQREINRSEVGRIDEILVEGVARDAGQLRGRTRRNKVVAFAAGSEKPGDYRWVELLSTTGSTFVGEPVDEPIPVGTA